MSVTRYRLTHFLILLVILPLRVFATEDISGTWQHASKDAVMEINLSSGKMTVKQHSGNPGAEGLTVIKDISADAAKPQRWIGQMFNGYIGAYVPVTIKRLREKELVIYDDKQGEVLRLYRD